MNTGAPPPVRGNRALRLALYGALLSATAVSAAAVKERRVRPQPLLALQTQPFYAVEQRPDMTPVPAGGADEGAAYVEDRTGAADPDLRWFNGRPVRPARRVWMTVTGYSPDERSCGKWADGKTATLHSVWTNGMKLVAADTSVLPFGSMLTVPGYAADQIVPVMDRGGAIKGDKLDLLFPTHERALEWGRRRIGVVVWEYADGEPADDPRRFR